MYVGWQTEEWGVAFFATPLMVKQQKAVEHVLNQAGEPYRGMWRIRRTHLEQIGEVTTGGDPENYFAWERPKMSQLPEFQPERRLERDEFLDAIYAAGVGKNRTEVEYWWNQFCKHALDWLVNKDKPVDMYFIRLHNSGYRANWKAVLLGRFPKLGQLLSHTLGKDQHYFAHKSGLLDQMTCLDLLAMNRERGVCYRMVEVEHRPQWWKNILRVEKTRHRRLGSAGYAKYFLESIRSKLGTNLRLYVEFLSNVARPSAADVECGLAGEFRLVPHLSRSDGVRPLPRKTVLVPIVVPNDPPTYSPPSDTKQVYPPDAVVSEVPSFQSNPENVRKSRGVLSQPDNAGPGTKRVLVRDVTEEPDGSQLLAS